MAVGKIEKMVLVDNPSVCVLTATDVMVVRVDPLSGKGLDGRPICEGRGLVPDSRF
jgi:hypothetical protein